MAKIMIVAERRLWSVIHLQIEPVLTTINHPHLESREPEQWESRKPCITTTGLPPEAIVCLRTAVRDLEPVVEVIQGETPHG